MKVFVFLLVISSCIKAQQSDSLLSVIISLQNDTERVNQLYKQGFSLRNHNPQLSFQYAKLCEKEAIATSSKKHLAKSYNLLGVLFYRKGNYKTALSYHTQALELRRACKDVLGIAYSETNLGNILVDLRLFDKAEASYLKALEAYRQLKNEVMEANSLINLGVLNQTKGQLDVALEYYKLALKTGEDINDYEIKSMCLNNLAGVCYEKGDYETSIGYNQDALKIRDLMGNYVEIADSYLNLANNNLKLKELSSAKSFLDSAYSTSLIYDYFELRMEACKSYAELNFLAENYKEAFLWLSKHQQLKDSILVQKDDERLNYSFDETEEVQSKISPPVYTNWLFASIALLLLIIPFFLIRYKR
jgi:tetratricopeptide (TPR) repeat protein